MKIETVLERALHLEAVLSTEEEEQTPKIALIRRDETKNLVEAVTKLVIQLLVDDKLLVVTETDHSEEMNRLGGTTGRVPSAKAVDRKDTFRGIVEIVSHVDVPNT